MANSRDWTEVNDASVNEEVWDKTGTIEGIYTRKRTNIGPNNSNMYILETPKADVSIWGSTILDSKFEQIQLGDEVKIEALGETKSESTGRTYKNFRVMSRPGVPFSKDRAQAVVANDDDDDDEVDTAKIPF